MSIANRPMATVRQVRDGRYILLLPEVPSEMPEDTLWVGDAVVASWTPDECSWFVCTDADDLSAASGGDLIDDCFRAWGPLPDAPRPLGARKALLRNAP